MKRDITMLLLLGLILALSGGTEAQLKPKVSCPVRDVAFELVTGYVFTSPEFILDTRPGVLLLEECLLYCKRNASCLSINYETGLCVLFASSAELNSGKNN